MTAVRKFEEEPDDDLGRINKEAGTESEEQAVARKPRIRSAKAALELKLMGATYPEIAQVLEFASPAAARLAMEQAIIDSGHGPSDADKDTVRTIMGMQLDQWHKSISRKIVDSSNTQQLEYMAMGLRLMERKARLYGVDAPTKIDVHNASNEEINNLIAAYQERLGLSKPVEGDPFEMVESDDGVWESPEGMGIDDDEPE